MENRANFRRNLIVRRTNLGWSQEELGERANLHRTAVSNLETGISQPRLYTIYDIAEALGVTAIDLLSDPPPLAKDRR
ncbi:UNVERIFIED_ORG: transcriptional regulator with XRE-family HTH domain [Agrobacterium larrymoorei]|uniref:XRE family transcriptional regulator n=2 Tax=Rhizobium/Agrobacterium group TaxID=227290 RepID=A0AA92BZ80_RHIRH|nr:MULTISPECIES: helix-turn-helix transcriptional regulator [Rhizobium/Agrobacterium group]MDP9573819.1 transcriptional regulator with XRE-family HTH domain [Agrobacterium larrymoorei]PVE62591.1 XRE family transcriptional regulator [Agrobacterium tumefaciens]PVE70729.1 XRE family transcriptional regulator [Sphingomonas sp. TPD3009]PVE50148.1 XRE family transcriptional regulator [Rhizobium rhizogenes]TBN14809.1 XRE family transcriptional regulator [Agrobacterium cavarae]